MRRASTCLALLGLAVLGLPAAASAVPVVTFKAKAVPIPGFPHTGNILGAGAAEQVEWTIKGNEYGGFAAPLIGVNVTEPAGTKLHPQGFTTCDPNALKNTGPSACPKKSKFTIAGKANGVVSFGNERVEEQTSVQGFFAPGGALQFYTQGTSPVSLEFISAAHVNYGSTPSIDTTVPLVETVPGAPDASVRDDQRDGRLRVQEGQDDGLLRHGAEEVPEGRLPAEVGTAVRRSRRPGPATVTTTYKAPCPRK